MFKWWAQVSPRERRLAALTGILVGISLAYLVYIQAIDRLATMDAQIDGLEQELVFYTEQMQLLDEVNRAYADVASEHSSAWTQEEIHDRLRREIARLSLMNPPPPGSEVSLSGGGKRLVEIRQMPQGTLTDSQAGFREYQLTIRTQPTSVQNITQFLERLHKSPQALRITQLDLTRPPDGTAVTARINVIRTVINTERAGPARETADPSKNWILNSGFENWDNDRSPANWTVELGTAMADTETAVEGQRNAHIQAIEAGTRFYQAIEIPAGTAFELEFTLRSTGPVTVQAMDAGTGRAVGRAVQLEAQPTLTRYTMKLTAPGEPGTPVAIQAPVFVLDEAGVEIAVDDVVLHEVGA